MTTQPETSGAGGGGIGNRTAVGAAESEPKGRWVLGRTSRGSKILGHFLTEKMTLCGKPLRTRQRELPVEPSEQLRCPECYEKVRP